MCPLLTPFIFILLIFGPFFILCSATAATGASKWNVTFSPNPIQAQMYTFPNITCNITGLNYTDMLKYNGNIRLKSDKELLVFVDEQINATDISTDGKWSNTIQIIAIFLGSANIYAEYNDSLGRYEKSITHLPVVVIRKDRVIDHVFTASVAALVSILYINFGAALDVTKLKAILVRPIGPIIGFCCQFFIMPIASYILGLIIFPENVAMQLGLFFTGVSPGGGASNIWTILLGGNMDMSIAMTTISTIAAFGMMPLWLFTLGKTIFDKGNLRVPYATLLTYVIALIIPLTIGLLIQRYLPRTAKFLTRILKTLSALLIVFIVIFAIVTNLYLFKLFSWEIVVAGLALPWIGYTCGWSISKLFRQNVGDSLAIAIDSGIQNTGIAIFILRLSLDQPQADLTTVIPVSVAIMTPIPLFFIYVGQKIRDWRIARRSRSFVPISDDQIEDR